MGSEDLFKKNRALKAHDIERKKHSRKGRPKVLIVCEDSKSSAYYLEDMARDLGLSAVTVEGERCGSAPSSVLEFALDTYKKSKKEGDAYDRVYCVFDRDSHESFVETVQKILNLKPKNTFFAITSSPCFEFWLLLHFVDSSAPFAKKGQKSACDCANDALVVADKLPNYGKNKHQTYADTKDKLVDAIKNAKKLVADNQKTGSNDPQTNLHELIEYLQSIKR